MKPASYSGFTLVEMLVGLALLGLMTLALFSALRVGLQSWDRAEIKSVQVVDLRIFESVLRRELGKAFPLRIGLVNENKVGFEGDKKHVRFVTALPANLSGGGLSLVSLELAEDRDGEKHGEKQNLQQNARTTQALIFKHVTPDGDVADFSALDHDKGEQSILVRGLQDVEFAFFGQENDQAELSWRDQWAPSARAPALLRVRLKFLGSDDPREMLVQLRLGEEAGCFQSTFQRICGPRR